MTTLKELLDARRARRAIELTAEENKVVERAVERLRVMQVAEQALQSGDSFPDFELADCEGRTSTLDSLLASGPAVIVFFRGGWCPYCDLALHAIDRIHSDLQALGASLVGIMPENRETLRQTCLSKKLSYPLLGDEGARIARLCGLQFEMTDEHVALYERRGLDMSVRHAGSGWELPVPGAFVVAQDATVAMAFVDPDYTNRAEPLALVEAVRRLGGA